MKDYRLGVNGAHMYRALFGERFDKALSIWQMFVTQLSVVGKVGNEPTPIR